jgi:hypothetical protein
MRQAIQLARKVLLMQTRSFYLHHCHHKTGFLIGLYPQALVDVAAATGQVLVPFGHKGGGNAMFISYFFNSGFKQHGFIGSS